MVGRGIKFDNCRKIDETNNSMVDKNEFNYIIAHPTGADEAGMKRLWHSCFLNDGDEFVDYYFRERTKHENTYCAFKNVTVNGKSVRDVVSMLHVIPMRFEAIAANDAHRCVVPVGFIAGVATAPEYRKQGLANALLREAEETCKGRFAAFVLSPANELFYSHAGYKTISYRSIHVQERDAFLRDYMCKAGAAPPHAPIASEMERIYDSFMNGTDEGCTCKTFYAMRTKYSFEVLIREYATEGGLALSNGGAYALGYIIERDGIKELELNEFAYEKRTSAFMLIDSLFSFAEKVELPLPASDTLFRNKGRIEPLNMIRVLDKGLFDSLGAESIEAYLERLGEKGSEAYSFELY